MHLDLTEFKLAHLFVFYTRKKQQMQTIKPTLTKITVIYIVTSLFSVYSADHVTEAQETYNVIGSELPRPITLDTPGIAIVTMEDIEEQQPLNIAEVFDSIPGVTLDGGTRSGGERINIRGFGETEDLNMVVDGAPIGFQQYRYGSFFFDPALIKTSTVIKGAHDVKTGNGGFGGSIYITTKDASDFLDNDDKFGVRAQAGYNSNDDLRRQSLTAYGRTDNGWQFLVNSVMRDANDSKNGGDQTVKYSAYQQENMLAKMSYQNANHEFKLSHTIYQDDGRKPWANRRGQMPTISDYNIKKYGSYEKALYANTVYNEYEDSTTTLNYNYTPPSQYINVNMVVARSENERHWRRPDIAWEKMYVSVGQYGHESWLTYKRDFADLTNTIYLDDHTIMAGVQYKKNDRESYVFNKSQAKKENKNYGYYTPYYEPSGTQQTSSFYVKDDYQLTNSLMVSPSIRYDYIRTEGKGNLASDYNDASVGHDYSATSHQGWIPRLGLTYDWSINTTLNFSYAYSLQAPTIDDIYTVQYAKASKGVSSSRDLEAQRIHAYNTGLTYLDNAIFTDNDNFAAEVALFYNDIENDIAQNRGDDVEKLDSWNTNLDGYQVYGAELMAQYRTKSFFLDSSLALTRGKHEGDYRDSSGEDDNIYTAAPLNINMGIGYSFFRGLTAGWKVRWYDRQDRVATTTYSAKQASDSYTLQDVHLKWLPQPSNDNLSVNLIVKNLTDRYYESYLANGVPSQGRDIRANIIYKW